MHFGAADEKVLTRNDFQVPFFVAATELRAKGALTAMEGERH